MKRFFLLMLMLVILLSVISCDKEQPAQVTSPDYPELSKEGMSTEPPLDSTLVAKLSGSSIGAEPTKGYKSRLTQSQATCNIVFDKPVLNQYDRGAFSERAEAGGYPQQLADEFVISANENINRVSWSGSYHKIDLPDTVTEIYFRIRFFNDDGGGAPERFPIHDELVTAQVTNSGVVFDWRIIYFFEADLSLPFSASGGATYWISILEEDSSTTLGIGQTFADSTWRWANSTVDLGVDVIKVRNYDGTSWRTTDGYRGNSAFQLQVCALEIMEVELDVKPQSCPNPLNTKSKGVLPVAVLGTANLNVIDIDVSTVKLEGVDPLRSNIEDVAAPVTNRQDVCDCTTDGPDGIADLTLKFDTQEIVTTLGDVNDGDVAKLTLKGNLNNGTPIEGGDCIVIINKK